MVSGLQDIQQKAAIDGTFRSALLTDPKGTLAAEGVQVPDGITVEVIEAGFRHLPIVIPPVRRGELTDEALTGVVGGGAPGSGVDFIASFIGS